jgi:hypothetical protein
VRAAGQPAGVNGYRYPYGRCCLITPRRPALCRGLRLVSRGAQHPRRGDGPIALNYKKLISSNVISSVTS